MHVQAWLTISFKKNDIFHLKEGDGFSSPLVQARMAIFQRDLSTAERIYIDQGSPDDAVRMYRQLLQWEDALRVAETYNLSDRHQIRCKVKDV